MEASKTQPGDPRGSEPDRLISKRAAAEMLSVSCRTIDRWVNLDRLEKVYLGSTIRLRLSEVQRLVREGCA